MATCIICGREFIPTYKPQKFCSLKCAYGHRRRDWTLEDVKFLKENHRLSTRELARILNKSINAINSKKEKLGLRWAGHKLEFTCQYCGRTFIGYRHSNGKVPRFCSYGCWVKGRDRTKDIGFCHPVHPNLSPSVALAYILGAIKGDGFCYQTSKHGKLGKMPYSVIGLSVNDYEFAQSFKLALEDINISASLISLQKYKSATTNWRITAYNREFVGWYNELALPDIFNLLTERRLAPAFFRGFYESEGSLYLAPQTGHFMLSLPNTNKELLDYMQKIMANHGFDFRFYGPFSQLNKPRLIGGNIAHFKKDIFKLVLYKKEQIRTLLTEIQPSIPRKQWRVRARLDYSWGW